MYGRLIARKHLIFLVFSNVRSELKVPWYIAIDKSALAEPSSVNLEC